MWYYNIKKCGESDYMISRKRTKAKFFFLGEKEEVFQQFRGSGTVWHNYPSGKRCPTTLEAWLADIWTAEQWREEDEK